MNNNIIICEASEKDLKKIADIEETVFSDPWTYNSLSSSFEGGNYLFITAKNEIGKVVGYAIEMSSCGEAEILRIAVVPEARKKGIGGKLLKRLTDISKECGNTEIFLEVRKSNVPAIALYSSFGFIKYGERRNYYKNPTENAVMMKLILGS